MFQTNKRQCSICLENFKQPKFLDCHHTFCLGCIRGLDEKSPGSFPCPLCQKMMIIPSGGVETLTSNFYIEESEQRDLKVDEAVNGDNGQRDTREDKPGNEDSEPRFEQLSIPTPGSSSVSFCNVAFLMAIVSNSSEKWGKTLAVSIRIDKPKSPFIKSCEIDYIIKLINQRDKNFSTTRTGRCQLLKNNFVVVDMIRYGDAFDKDHSFISNIHYYTNGSVSSREFDFEIEFKVFNKEFMNFNLE